MNDPLLFGLIVGLGFSVLVNLSWVRFCWRLDDEWAEECERIAREWQQLCAHIVLDNYRRHVVEGR